MKLPTTRHEKVQLKKTFANVFPLPKKRSIALNATVFVTVSAQLPRPGFYAG